jgi:serine O-acetyltransferase
VVLQNLPANCTAVGVPAEVVRINNTSVIPADDLDQQDIPDLTAQHLTELDRRLSRLEQAAQGDIPPTTDQINARRRTP